MELLLIPEDMATWMYALGALVKGYGFGLFMWWICKAKRADAEISTMFIYITILLFGSALRDLIETYGGFCRGTLQFDTVQMRTWVYDTWFWPARMVIPNAVFLILVGHMSYRAFWQRWHYGDDK